MRVLIILALFLALTPFSATAANGIEAITIAGDGKSYSVTLQILAVMTVLTVLPSLLVMMTSFTRIIVVFSILRQAMGTPQTPSNQILLGLALFLTFFIMSPVLEKANNEGLQPYLNDQIAADVAITKVIEPFRSFMLRQTRNDDLEMFARISGAEPITDASDVPLSLLLPAFVTSELKTAFQIGFMIFVPFLIIDMVVASVLMSMGMMMLSPLIISLPFKLMLFVLVDGWALIMETLAASFFT
ncbi:MAG: flagellar type III secretion system pore protein FliP [Cycloclasticus sp.]|jgi:flagellar biosynthetic protein FliP|nr:MAG: flagellar biosynthesis protein flip [Cycloclasticus sp. Phe_18]MBV1912896.1 flagellar type III secretion system pore protein FliP [Cycloclasticus sp.]MDF1690132.1 flagellar type III secretion system pore protein FliP [Cycloclasticus sp.]